MKGAIFDLDGTLTLTQQFHYKSFAEVFKKFGVNYSTIEDFYYAGSGGENTFLGVFKDRGISGFDLKWCVEEKKRIYNKILETEEIKLVPGAKDFLEKLRRGGILCAVASGNRPEFVDEILDSAAIKNFFAVSITNHEVKHGKPHPDIFLACAEKLGLKPEDCAVFEDAWSGIQAAKAARMYCVALETSAPKKLLIESGADLTIKDYNELKYETLFL